MKLSYSTLACADWNLDKVIKFAKKFNYDGVELRGKKPQISKDFNQNKRKKIKKKFKTNDLEIPCITAYTRFNAQNYDLRQKNIYELKEMIDLASDLGANYVRTFGSSSDNEVKKNKIIGWIAEAFRGLDAYADEKDVKILLETHDNLSTGEDVNKIFKNNEFKNCGVLWDVAHSIRSGESIQMTLKYLKDYIYHIHLKDWINLEKDKDYYVLLGAGILPLENLLSELKKINYKGYLSLEWEKMWLPEIEKSEIAIPQYPIKMKQYFRKINL